MRLYLPAQDRTIAVDWIELVSGDTVRRWDFGGKAAEAERFAGQRAEGRAGIATEDGRCLGVAARGDAAALGFREHV